MRLLAWIVWIYTNDSILAHTTINYYFLVCTRNTHNSWEQWILRVVVNNTPRPISENSAAVIERQRLQDTAEGMLKSVLVKIFDIAGGDIQHIPPVMYDYSIVQLRSGKRADERENVYARVANMPSLINLGNWREPRNRIARG